MYLKEFGELIQKFHEIEKASSENFGEVSDDAKNVKKHKMTYLIHYYFTI